jgi:hypothetical protein
VYRALGDKAEAQRWLDAAASVEHTTAVYERGRNPALEAKNAATAKQLGGRITPGLTRPRPAALPAPSPAPELQPAPRQTPPPALNGPPRPKPEPEPELDLGPGPGPGPGLEPEPPALKIQPLGAQGQPQRELRFAVAVGQPTERVVLLTNEAARAVCFKVRTTAPQSYIVKPNSAVVKAGGTARVRISLQAKPALPRPDRLAHKFLVQIGLSRIVAL